MASAALLPAVFLSFFLFSCATTSSRKNGEAFPYEKILENSEGRSAMSGLVKFTHTSGGKSVTAPGVMLAEWPNRFRLEVQDPVGSMLALLVIQGERFWLFEKGRKENLTGPLSALPGGFFRQLGLGELLRVVLARPELEPFRNGEVKENVAVAGDGRFRQTLRWSSGRALVESWSFERRGEPKRTVEYSDYEARSGTVYPTQLRLLTESDKRPDDSLLIVWSEWEPTVPKNEKLFQIPQEQSFGRPTKALP